MARKKKQCTKTVKMRNIEKKAHTQTQRNGKIAIVHFGWGAAAWGWGNKLNLLLIFWSGSHKFSFSYLGCLFMNLPQRKWRKKPCTPANWKRITAKGETKANGQRNVLHRFRQPNIICHKVKMRCDEDVIMCKFHHTCWISTPNSHVLGNLFGF